MMKILIIEPYYTGSHAAWADGIIKYSKHDVALLKMPGRYWKWRMHGGSITLAREFEKLDYRPDLIIATDMIDLSGFLALTRKDTHSIPTAIYFHENQLNYPWSPTDRDVINERDRHYGFINYISSLSADAVLFNSEFHKKSFVNSLPSFLKHFPDYNELSSVDLIRSKSRVLHLGIELSKFDQYMLEITANKEQRGEDIAPIILWNHRWEYDKNPSDFFDALYVLQERDIDFRLVLLGEKFDKIPQEFEIAKERLGSKIIKLGYAESFEEYAHWLWISDILPISSIQDFFGISIIEALYCECVPCFPKRLTYPELVPMNEYGEYFYDENNSFQTVLEKIITDYDSHDRKSFRNVASQFDWKNMIGEYDRLFEELI